MRRYIVQSLIGLLVLSSLMTATVPLVGATDDFALRVRSVFWGTNYSAPETAFVGEENKPLTLMIVNSGAAIAFDARATLYLEYPFSYSYVEESVEQTEIKVTAYAGIIPAGNFSLLTYTLDISPDAQDGTYRIRVQLEYEDGNGFHHWRIRSIDVVVYGPGNSLVVQDVVTEPGKVHPGDTFVNYRVSIFNNGKSSYKEVSVEFRLTELFKASSSDSDRMFLGTIQPEQMVEATFFLDIDKGATPGSYSLELIITYFPFQEPISAFVPLVINEKAQFETLTVEPSTVSAGENEVVVTVSVKNISENATAEGVWATLKAGNLFEGTTADYLGTLHPGESKTASFVLDVDEKAHGSYLFDLELDWTQEDKEFDETLLVTINVTQSQYLSGQNQQLYAGGVVLFFLLVLGIVIRRRRRRQ